MRSTVYHSGVHLEGRHLRPAESKCPLCSFGGERSAFLSLQSEPEVTLLACPNCGGFSASRLPTEEALREYYAKYYEQDTFQGAGKVTFHKPNNFARHLVSKAKPFLNRPSLQILDFGGGDGNLSIATAQLLLEGGASHVHINLVDYNSVLARVDNRAISFEYHENLVSAGAMDCDLVLASAILEHIPYPQEDFTRLLSALRAGGVFYARTPCVASLFRTLQRIGLSVDFTFPAHVHDMGEGYWSNVLSLLPPAFQGYSLIWSHPSPVESSLRKDPLRTVAAHVLKAPWRIFRKHYQFVGGWEVLIRRPSEGSIEKG
jgi:SAM-dependent methyltransferase